MLKQSKSEIECPEHGPMTLVTKNGIKLRVICSQCGKTPLNLWEETNVSRDR